MDEFEAIKMMCERTGLGYEQVSNLAGFDEWYVEQALREGTGLRLDSFLRVADACGYRLMVKHGNTVFAVKPDMKRCSKDSDTTASLAVDRVFQYSEHSPYEVSRKLGKPSGFVSYLISNHSIPMVASFVSIANTAGCQLNIRKFHESYVLGEPIDAQRCDTRPEAEKNDDVRVVLRRASKMPRKAKASGAAKRSTSSIREEEPEQSVGLLISEAFKTYSRRLNEQGRNDNP